MSPCFADTFFFLALLNRSDERYHDRSLQLNRVDRPIITTEWVLLELADHLCDQRNRHLSAAVRQSLADDQRFKVIPALQTMLDRAVAMYDARLDKDWSLTDCTSFLVMSDLGLNEALTGDRHFEQAGFRALFNDPAGAP